MAKTVEWRNGGKMNRFEKWESWNPKWRPKKWIAHINKELKKEGYKEVRKQDIESTYLFLINLPEDKLKELLLDKNQPILVKILIKNIVWWKSFDIIEKMLDRAFWKPKQPTEELWEKQIQIKIINYEEKS